ncbi:hypothetical protein PWG14_06470 (plasmid) [Chromobacterium amazonense]|uniref:DUF5610 domain-containing protein n=1 Tax=Chromobacterium amazonense TaxID=1382803 RepID=UPI00237E4E76|nr:DUF5610 domain-containing protein [Chromobacterium amazonense]MDE1712372.1 hypothetical protein [Chromobacterium amazonense]
MAIDDDIIISPISPVHPRQGNRVSGEGWRAGGHGEQQPEQDDSADIGLSRGHQAAELLYSATMDQVAHLGGLDHAPGPRPEGELPGTSHSQHLLLGIAMLFERYCQSHPHLSIREAGLAFAPLARQGLDRGLQETCQVLIQLNALPPATQAQLQGLHQLTSKLLDERFGIA